MKKFLEIETKYKANGIKIKDFVNCVKRLGKYRIVNVSSHDYYFVKSKDKFIRFRTGDRPELTMKSKIKRTNNFVRVEMNMRLDPNQAAEDQLTTVEKFCELLDFKHNFTIYKTCFIYFFKTFNVVYYLVFDEQMNETSRFIEIEMSEEHSWASEEECWNELVKIEKELAPIGITSANRIRKSLFEMYRIG